MTYQDRSPSLSDLAELNWDFGEPDDSTPFSQFHWYPGRFPPQIPAVAIRALSGPGELVLDPFAGCGTTLVEAVIQGRMAIGIDTNPVGCLIARAKVLDSDLDAMDVAARKLIIRIEDLVNSGASVREPIPNLAEQTLWYEQRTLTELGHIWSSIGDLTEDDHRLAFTASFSAILRFVCSQEHHWGWICDNVKPKELVHKSAVSKFAGKLTEYMLAARRLHSSPKMPEARVFTGSCAAALKPVPSDSVDLVVTSPPYFGVTDYAKAQRLTNLWLDVDLEPVRRSETGARSKRHRKSAVDQYLAEMREALAEVARVLRAGRFAVVVIGQSAAREPVLPEVAEMMADIGLASRSIIHRRLPAQRGKNASLSNEQVWILQYV